MEENITTEQTTQAENMGEQDAQGAAADKGKLFTQDEVNGFVQSRISRLKGQLAKEAQAEYTQKFEELQGREIKLYAREQLIEKKMPKELADIITCTDESTVNAAIELLSKHIEKEKKFGFVQIGGNPPKEQPYTRYEDKYRKAMGLEAED